VAVFFQQTPLTIPEELFLAKRHNLSSSFIIGLHIFFLVSLGHVSAVYGTGLQFA
jgi:hypothetical protein